MGYILNRFDKLMELSENSTLNEQFKLTAIIVHNPKDRDLIEYIRSKFLFFARLTGEKFLFITFVQPPKEYADAIRRGEYKYAKLLVSDSKQQSNTDIIINSLIRDYYDLPDEGSYLVLAKKLSDRKVYRVRITTNSLLNQLSDLTFYCENPQDFDGLINKLEGRSINISEMILDSLLKISSLISPSSSPDSYSLYSNRQYNIANRTIQEEKRKIIAALKRSSDDEDFTDKILQLYCLIEYAYMNVFNKGHHYSYKPDKCKNYHLLDRKSQTFWDTYSRLSGFLKNASRDELDYSAFILYLGKIVETELNLSVCQMLRQSMGIDMPRYYNRYYYTRDNIYIPTERQDVPLNKFIRSEDGKVHLEGVPLGNLLHAYKTAVGEEIPRDVNWSVYYPEYLEQIPTAFLPLWENIAKARNNAAHSRSVNAVSLENAERYFKEFLEIYYFVFNELKELLRPRTNSNYQQNRH